MQAPGGPEEDPSDTFTHGGWQAPFPDPAVGEFVTKLNSHASAFLFGRRTFDIFRGYWPDQTDPANPIATAINSLPKYVVSHSLSEADATWRGEHPDTARLVTGDVAAAVQALKDEPGDELQIWGSSQLLQMLLQHELVDRFRLMTFPLVLGSGRRLFNDGILPATMRPAGLTHDQAMACLKDQSKADAIVAIGKRATDEIKMTGTPTFVIDGKVYGGELSMDQLKAILDPLIKK